jgi:hypothetical protein
MTNWGTTYWRGYNVLVRVLGLLALLSGATFVVWGGVRLLQLGSLHTETAPAWVLLAVGLLAATLGVALLRAPSYRPDLGDASWHFDPFGKKAQQMPPSRRSWWTGDRVKG